MDRKYVALGTAALAILGSSLAIYFGIGSPATRAQVGASTVQACESPVNWSSEGSALMQSQQAHPSTNSAPSGVIVQTPFAYQSLPVDISGDGNYAFDFGPLNSSFNWPTDPFGFALQWPDSFAGAVRSSPTVNPRTVQINGSPYFQIGVDVTGVSCTGLTLWIY